MSQPSGMKTDLQRAIDANPCPTCQKARLPKCRCMVLPGDDCDLDDEIFSTDAIAALDSKKIADDEEITAKNERDNNQKLALERISDPALRPRIDDDNVGEIWADQLSKLFDVLKNIYRCELTFRINKALTPDEDQLVKSFLQYLMDKFAEFKDKMKTLGVDVANFSVHFDSKKNSFMMRIPHATLFDDFVNELEKKLQPRHQKQPNYLNPFKMELESR